MLTSFKNKLYGQIILAVFSAVLLILSTAGFGLYWCVFIAFIPLFYALGANKPKPLITGLITGFLYWSVSLSWMTTTFGYFGGAPVPATIGLLFIISAVGGLLFFAPFTTAFTKYKSPLLVSIIFVMLEAIKGAVFFGGVPWLNLAQSQYKNLLILQSVSVYGEYGLSFLIMIINIFIFQIINNYKNKQLYINLALAVITMIFPGIYRTINHIEIDGDEKIAIIQPAYDQKLKWKQEHRLPIIENIFTQIDSLKNQDLGLLVLPESTFPAAVLESPFIIERLKNYSYKFPILFGTNRREYTSFDKGTYKVYNSMVLIQNGNIQIYNKRHLTPFGEYFPFEDVFEPVKKYFFGAGVLFSAGNEDNIFESGCFNIAPVICFESAFSDLLSKPVLNGANIIAAISNDTWFGKNQGKVQHLSVDTLRAVEYGRTVLRATQDGISAVILYNGKIPVVEEKPVPTILEYEAPLVSHMTFFALYGNVWVIPVLIIIALRVIWKKYTIKKQPLKDSPLQKNIKIDNKI